MTTSSLIVSLTIIFRVILIVAVENTITKPLLNKILMIAPLCDDAILFQGLLSFAFEDLLRIGGLLFGDPVAISNGEGGSVRLPGLRAQLLEDVCDDLQPKRVDFCNLSRGHTEHFYGKARSLRYVRHSGCRCM